MREWLCFARIKRNLSQADMAKSMCISVPYYSLIERGQRQNPMDLQTVWKLSKALDMSTKEIVSKEMCDIF